MRDDFLDGSVVQDRLAVWRERLARPAANQLVVVAEEGGGIEGFVCVFGDDDARWGSLIDNLHVRLNVQKRGVGRQLMREAAAWVMANYPAGGMYLWVLQANVNAQRFYERLGGVNAGAEVIEGGPGGTVPSYRYSWPDVTALLSVV